MTLRSPDGQYALTGLTLASQVSTAPSAQPLAADRNTCAYWARLHLCSLAQVAYPDRAVESITALARNDMTIKLPQRFYTQWPSVDIATRPDGRVVAALLPGDGFHRENGAQVRVTLFSAETA